MTAGQKIVGAWFKNRGWKAFQYQKDAWLAYNGGKHGVVNAPTGSGKTYSMFMALVQEYIDQHPTDWQEPRKNGLLAIWITPIRALAKEIQGSAQRVIDDLGLPWKVGIRTGDTPTNERQKQKKNPPEFLITTPESIHLLLAQKDYPKFFKNLNAIIADEWHELVGSKRGVQVELALSRFKTICPKLRVWGISATIGNMEEAIAALLGDIAETGNYQVVKGNFEKEIEVISILPDEIEKFPWAGHLGIKLLEKVLPIIHKSRSTLIFLNTRAMAEIWYQNLLVVDPDLAGLIAMHHGSISKSLRYWVEDALYEGRLKAVVCTSSLDLGVDFRPVETIIQIGSPKGVARFMQRAGRSGHQPGAKSKIYFLPTHALELVEAAALREATKIGHVEERPPFLRSFDVLIQYLVTLAVSDGFEPNKILPEIKSTLAYESINEEEWKQVLTFIRSGSKSLQAYEDYKKVDVLNGLYKVTSRKIAMRHRMSIGTIVSIPMMAVRFLNGAKLGHVEEYFISRLKPGDVFWFGGHSLEFRKIKGLDVLVKKSKRKTRNTPSYMGGRMSLSSKMSSMLRQKINEAEAGTSKDIELITLKPLLDEQARRSKIPKDNEFLIEVFESKEGHHVIMYPFEGRNVHEGMASVIAYRMSLLQPISINIAYNDYGFELLSDQPLPLEEALDNNFFTHDHLYDDLIASINSSDMAGKRFWQIATIAGLIFQGYPNKRIKEKHLQASSSLLFKVFEEYEKDNLLLRQAYEEVLDIQIEETRLREALMRIQKQKLVVTHPGNPTPFAFPIMVDRLREKMSSESLEQRVAKMKLAIE